MSDALRIGTRGSRLALAQATMVRDLLADAHPDAPPAELVVIRTTGDKVQDRTLAEIGGKGLFTKEIEEALLDRRIDLAVHSMKDVTTWLPDGLTVDCLLPREDPRDALFGGARSLAELAPGTVVGTASLRRAAQVLLRRPDVTVVPFRGNVDTRLDKLKAGEVDATLLAVAGLRRLDMAERIEAVLETDEMLPAVAQGAVGIERRGDDDRVASALAPLNDTPTAICVAAERALLEVLDGSCRTPIAALARLDGDRLALHGLIVKPDGSHVITTEREGLAADAAALGADAGAELKARAGPGFLD